MTKENKELAVLSTQVPDYLKGKLEDKRGNENVSMDEMTVPRLEIVQSLSACRKKTDSEYIEGADEGMLYNNVTRQLYGEDVHIVFGGFEVKYLAWGDRKKGGGFFGGYDSLDAANTAIEALGEEATVKGVEAQKTHQHYGFILDKKTGLGQPISISMAKTKEKVSRRLNSVISMQRGARFSKVYRLFTVQEQNKSGDAYYNYNFEPVGYPSEKIYLEAEKIYNMSRAGDLKVNEDFEDVHGSIKESKTEF